MDENITSGSDQPKVAPAVSSISLEELNAIKDTIAPVRSKSEEEMLCANPDIDPNTVYSSYKPKGKVKKQKNDKKVELNETLQETISEPEATGVVEKTNSDKTKNNEPNINQTETLQDSHQENVENKSEVVSDANLENSKQSQTEAQAVVEDDTSLNQEKPKTATKKATGRNFKNKQKNKIQNSQNNTIEKIEQSGPNTTKIDMSELLAVKSTLKHDENGNVVRDEPPAETVQVEPQIQREYSDEDGDYDRTLDFEKVKDIKKYRLPLNKKPIIIGVIAFVLVSIVSLLVGVLIQNQKNRVYVTGYDLNIKEITGGYVGETVDLSGVHIIKNLSNGKSEIIYDISRYIKGSSKQINTSNLQILSANDMSYISFSFEDSEKDLYLTVRTLDKLPTAIKYVKGVKTTFAKGDTLRFDELLVKVKMGEYGTKLLSADEVKNNVNLLFRKLAFEKNEDGFVMQIDNFTGEKLEVAYTESGVTKSYYLTISVASDGTITVAYS